MITYQQETYAEVIDEIKPLLEQHHQEVDIYSDKVKINPDYNSFQVLESLGMLDIYTARDSDANNALIGYCVTLIQKHHHYSDHVYAINDILYVDPEYRHTEVAPELISKVEERMVSLGVSVMTFNMKPYKPFKTLMDSLGFEESEIQYSKYIKDQ